MSKNIAFFVLVFNSWILGLNCELDASVTNWISSTGTTSASAYVRTDCVNNVFQVSYTDEYVYIRANGVPSYSIGGFGENPGLASCKDYTYQIPRTFSAASTKTITSLGSIGAFLNGVPIYNLQDGVSYNNQGVWNNNAYATESDTFDSCNGHPNPQGSYHMHCDPKCIYDSTQTTTHSALLGYFFDGSPLYGPYSYSDPNDSSSSIVRQTSSYRLNTALNSGRTNGPNVDSTYFLGYFIEDYEYVNGLGTLDQYNGKWTKTPEYPNGVYAYFITRNTDGTPAFPYMIHMYYNGVKTGSDSATIPANAVLYDNSNGAMSKFTTNYLFLLFVLASRFFLISN